MNNALCLTCGHKTCRFQWFFERFVPSQVFATVDSDAVPQSGTFHTSKRYHQEVYCKKVKEARNVELREI